MSAKNWNGWDLATNGEWENISDTLICMTNGVTIMAERHRNEGQVCELKSLLLSFLLLSFLQETLGEEQGDCVCLLSLCVLVQQELWFLQDAAEAHPEKPVNVVIMDIKTTSATILKGIPYMPLFNVISTNCQMII